MRKRILCPPECKERVASCNPGRCCLTIDCFFNHFFRASYLPFICINNIFVFSFFAQRAIPAVSFAFSAYKKHEFLSINAIFASFGKAVNTERIKFCFLNRHKIRKFSGYKKIVNTVKQSHIINLRDRNKKEGITKF
jgi:hypothetical protein